MSAAVELVGQCALLDSDAAAGVALVPGAVEHFSGGSELDNEVARQVLWIDTRQSWIRAGSSLSMMIRASEPPMKARRPKEFVHTLDLMASPLFARALELGHLVKTFRASQR